MKWNLQIRVSLAHGLDHTIGRNIHPALIESKVVKCTDLRRSKNLSAPFTHGLSTH